MHSFAAVAARATIAVRIASYGPNRREETQKPGYRAINVKAFFIKFCVRRKHTRYSTSVHGMSLLNARQFLLLTTNTAVNKPGREQSVLRLKAGLLLLASIKNRKKRVKSKNKRNILMENMLSKSSFGQFRIVGFSLPGSFRNFVDVYVFSFRFFFLYI